MGFQYIYWFKLPALGVLTAALLKSLTYMCNVGLLDHFHHVAMLANLAKSETII